MEAASSLIDDGKIRAIVEKSNARRGLFDHYLYQALRWENQERKEFELPPDAGRTVASYG